LLWVEDKKVGQEKDRTSNTRRTKKRKRKIHFQEWTPGGGEKRGGEILSWELQKRLDPLPEGGFVSGNLGEYLGRKKPGIVKTSEKDGQGERTGSGGGNVVGLEKKDRKEKGKRKEKTGRPKRAEGIKDGEERGGGGRVQIKKSPMSVGAPEGEKGIYPAIGGGGEEGIILKLSKKRKGKEQGEGSKGGADGSQKEAHWHRYLQTVEKGKETRGNKKEKGGVSHKKE